MRRRTKTAALCAAALIPLGSLAACASDPEPGGSSSTGVPAQLTLALGGEPDDGFDPTLGWGRYGSPLFQSTLLQRDADMGFSGDLATDWELSDDGLVWTVSIRDDATFTDGSPVTAEDVAYTFTTASKSGGLTDVTVLRSARAVDPTTVELELKRPQSTFVNRLASLGVVPAEGHDKGYAQEPVGSGPYTFVSWEPGQQLVVTRNDDYYGEQPEFERIVFLFTDEDATLAALRAGELDVAGVPSSMASEDVAGTRVVAVPSLDNRALSFPTVPDEGKKAENGAPIGNDVTSDVAIRRAVNVAVDRAALVEGVLDGHGSPAFGPVDKAPWFEPSTVIDDADPEAAGDLLEAAGWRDADGDGVREKDGVDAEFVLLYPAGDSLRQNLAIAAADMVAAAGIRVEAKAGSWEEIEQRMHADAVMFGWGSHDPMEMYNLLASDQAGVGYNNPGMYSNAEVDRALGAALAATDADEATKHWQAAQVPSGAAADAPWAWLVNLDHTYYVDECIDLGPERIEPHGHGWPLTAGITGWRWTC
jgi:peptide/nickel transport system substrate-binding protein